MLANIEIIMKVYSAHTITKTNANSIFPAVFSKHSPTGMQRHMSVRLCVRLCCVEVDSVDAVWLWGGILGVFNTKPLLEVEV